MNGPTRRALLGGALRLGAAALLALAGCSKRERLAALPAGSTVLALGDSITFGTGATPESSWPSVLAASTGWRIVNAGVPGDTSGGALQRLPALLAEHRPALVIVSIGGNDFLRRLPEADTRGHLERIVAAARDAGAQVLLVGVPRPTLAGALTGALSDHPLYEDVADALRTPLVGGLWAKVLGDERLKSDPIHANAEGYRVFAEALHARLRELGLAP